MHRFSFFVPLACVLLACACGASPSKQVTARPALRPWNAQLDRDHPLVGRIWDVARGVYISEDELHSQLQQAQVISIGERHDHVDHHLLQAALLQGVIDGGRHPGLVFEMLERKQQETIDASVAAHPKDADALAAAVAWEHSGWPAWALYRPLFVSALTHELPIFAAGLDRATAMRLAREGTSALDPELVRVFGLQEPLPPAQHAQLRQEMRDAHCGLMPESMLDDMLLVQRARDALLAQLAQRAHAKSDTAVVFSGNGHARNDRGVPVLLAQVLGLRNVSIGLLEVRAGVEEPARYAHELGASRLPFDYVWFTPRQNDVDHCVELRKSMSALPTKSP